MIYSCEAAGPRTLRREEERFLDVHTKTTEAGGYECKNYEILQFRERPQSCLVPQPFAERYAPAYCCIGVTFKAADLGPVYMGTNHHNESKKKRKKNTSHKHIILKILILFVPDETVSTDSNLQNCSKCVFSCCSTCLALR